MKKIVIFIISFIFINNVYALDLNSKYAYVYNVKEDKVMYEKDSNKEIKVASLTKIMTAIIAIENIDNINKEVIISARDYRDYPEYAVAKFNIGERVTIKDLLFGALLPSGSEAVNALVRVTTDSEEEFIKLMNEKALELNLKNTHFSNPIGKDDNNYSTMSDIAKILEYALKNKTFKEIFETKTHNVNNHLLNGPLVYLNTNLINGAKTGFTYEAMYCLASFSNKYNFNYIVVTAYADSYENVMNDHINIYEYFYDNYNYYNYNVNFNIEIKNGINKYYNIDQNFKIYLNNKDLLTYKYEGIKEINQSIKYKDKLGKILIYYDDELIDYVDVYLNQKIEYKNYLLLNTLIIILLILIILTIIDNLKNINKKHRSFKLSLR